MFINRKEEKEVIEKRLNSPGFEFFILYGRRRIGKTSLVLEAIKERQHIYYLATEKDNLRKFAEHCALKFPELANYRQDWEVIFDFLKGKADIIVLDEFQNFIAEDRSFLSLLQKIIDSSLSRSGLKLFILGSSVSMLDSAVLSYKSPLYGRKTGSLKLRQMDLFDSAEFFQKRSMQELVEIHGFAGGVPYYLIKIDRPFWHWLSEELKRMDSFLKNETHFIMKYEFSDIGTYSLILEAIARGRTTIGEIKDFARLKRTDVSPYLQKLISTDFISRETPIIEKKNSRNSRYFINDQFVSFWYRFIYPNLSSIEERVFDARGITANYNEYLGFVFEKACLQFLLRKIRAGELDYLRVGRQWGRIPSEFRPEQGKEQYEIDLVALNDKKKEVLFAECKWKGDVDAERIARELNAKAKYVLWNNKSRKEVLAVFAKSFSRKITEFEGKKVMCFGLKDFENVLN